jgi:hypothetical protein
MERRKVVGLYWLPVRIPIVGMLTFWLTLDRLQAPEWVWGVFGVFVAVTCVAWGICLWNDEYREPVWKDK